MRYVLILILALVPSVAFSQASPTIQPLVSVDTPEGEVIVGQSAIIRIKVLVPTYMPSPPIFPALEQENLLVRLPERASGPVSETIDGETWSGVQRSYRLYPLRSGTIDLGQLDIAVTFADPDSNEPVEVTVSLPQTTINAVVPKEASTLNPLIIATGFTVEQELEGAPELQAGGSITRRLTARISGTTPILIPALIPVNQDELLRAYPKEPRFVESEDRGVLSGQRIDEVVYLAQSGGTTQLPAVVFEWFNLATNQIETIQVPAVDLKLQAPERAPRDPQDVLTALAWLALIGVLAWLGLRWAVPCFRDVREARRRAYQASSQFAFVQLRHAVKSQDLSAAYSALELWKNRSENKTELSVIEAALTQIGASLYAPNSTEQKADWSAAIAALDHLKNTPRNDTSPLPPLNP